MAYFDFLVTDDTGAQAERKSPKRQRELGPPQGTAPATKPFVGPTQPAAQQPSASTPFVGPVKPVKSNAEIRADELAKMRKMRDDYQWRIFSFLSSQYRGGYKPTSMGGYQYPGPLSDTQSRKDIATTQRMGGSGIHWGSFSPQEADRLIAHAESTRTPATEWQTNEAWSRVKSDLMEYSRLDGEIKRRDAESLAPLERMERLSERLETEQRINQLKDDLESPVPPSVSELETYKAQWAQKYDELSTLQQKLKTLDQQEAVDIVRALDSAGVDGQRALKLTRQSQENAGWSFGELVEDWRIGFFSMLNAIGGVGLVVTDDFKGLADEKRALEERRKASPNPDSKSKREKELDDLGRRLEIIANSPPMKTTDGIWFYILLVLAAGIDAATLLYSKGAVRGTLTSSFKDMMKLLKDAERDEYDRWKEQVRQGREGMKLKQSAIEYELKTEAERKRDEETRAYRKETLAQGWERIGQARTRLEFEMQKAAEAAANAKTSEEKEAAKRKEEELSLVKTYLSALSQKASTEGLTEEQKKKREEILKTIEDMIAGKK